MIRSAMDSVLERQWRSSASLRVIATPALIADLTVQQRM
jgi:hypothetical protein